MCAVLFVYYLMNCDLVFHLGGVWGASQFRAAQLVMLMRLLRLEKGKEISLHARPSLLHYLPISWLV